MPVSKGAPAKAAPFVFQQFHHAVEAIGRRRGVGRQGIGTGRRLVLHPNRGHDGQRQMNPFRDDDGLAIGFKILMIGRQNIVARRQTEKMETAQFVADGGPLRSGGPVGGIQTDPNIGHRHGALPGVQICLLDRLQDSAE